MLSDPQKRAAYDQDSEAPRSGPAGGGGGGAGGGFGGPGFPGFGAAGVPGVRSSFSSASSFPGGGMTSPDDLFKRFFGTSNPFEAERSSDSHFGDFPAFGAIGGMPGAFSSSFSGSHAPFGGGAFAASGQQQHSSSVPQSPFHRASTLPSGMSSPPRAPIEHTFSCTLEELYTGCVKKMKVRCTLPSSSLQTSSQA